MTKSVLVLPSDLYREADRAKQLEKELAEKKAENELILAERDSALAENESLRRQLQELQAQKN